MLSACTFGERERTSLTKAETKTLGNIEVEAIYNGIEELVKEPRIAGMESEKKAAKLLEEQLRKLEYEVEVQSFSFDQYTPPIFVGLSVNGVEKEFEPAPFKYSVAGKVEGEFINIGDGKKTDYEKVDAAGKIVVVGKSDLDFYEIVLNAAEVGAVGVVFHFTEELSHVGWTLGYNDELFIPALALSKDDGNELIKLIESEDPVIGELIIEDARVVEKESQNIIATKKTVQEINTTEDIVIIGAHYDTVEYSPGASDNASGVAILLEIARVLEEVPTDKEIRFIFFGAEEIEFLGSEKYVEKMTDNEIEKVIAMFNMDMVGSTGAGPLTMFTVNGMPNHATKIGNDTNEKLFGESLSIQLADRSDHLYFHHAGIDAVLFSYYPLEESYHSPEDTIDKISKERLEETAKIITLSILELANLRTNAN